MENIMENIIEDRDSFTTIVWPDSQELMEKRGFEENSVLINDEPLLSEYGSSAYLVRNSWLREQE